jgi:polygalacturonase
MINDRRNTARPKHRHHRLAERVAQRAQVRRALDRDLDLWEKGDGSVGGGVVVVPKGLWLTGPIVMKSNVNLHLQTGATLLFTKEFSQYSLVATNWEGLAQMRNQSPISAEGASNIAITGQGIIDGNGDAWRMVKKDKLSPGQWKRLQESGGVLSEDKKTWYPSEKSLYGTKFNNPGVIKPEKTVAFYDSVKDFLRPNMVLFTQCKKILLEGVTFQNSPAWCRKL